MTETQKLVLLEVSRHPKGDEITGAKLANSVDLKPRDTGKEGADLRSVINALRRSGYPVCANSKGYYWPKDQTEMLDYQESLRHRIDQMQEAYDGIEHARQLMGTQPPLGMVEQLHKNVREI